MIEMPKYTGTPYIKHADNGYGYKVADNVPEEIREDVEKDVLDYNKRSVKHLNRTKFRGYVKMKKTGEIYLSSLAPKVLKDEFCMTDCPEFHGAKFD